MCRRARVSDLRALSPALPTFGGRDARLLDQARRGACPATASPRVSFEWETDVPDASLVTNPRKLTVVVRNLVGNALKFIESGWVRADARIAAETLVLRIADWGMGGTVGVESVPGRSAAFTVSLPRGVATSSSRAA